MRIVQPVVLVAILPLLGQLLVAADQTTDVRVARGLTDLAEKWRIEDPDFNFEDHKFMLRWRVSDFVQDHQATYRIYDGVECKEGANDVTEGINDWNNNNAYMQNMGLRPDNSTLYNPGSNGEGIRDMRLFLAIQPTAQNAPIFYYEDGNELKAKIEFCIRFSLYNGEAEEEDSPDVVEVNFQETIVTFTADMTDGFEIQDVVVKPADRDKKEAFIGCKIEAYECDRDNVAVENPGYLRSQGQDAVTRVCVTTAQESRDEGLLLDRILWFNWIMDEPGVVVQPAIVMDSKADPLGLTRYSCMRGVEVCPFETILRAEFFYWLGPSIVKGIGQGLCMYGSGASTIVEDVTKQIGTEIFGWKHQEGSGYYTERCRVSGFPKGTTLSYTDIDQNFVSLVMDDESYEIDLTAVNDEDLIRASLDSIIITAPEHSDENFSLDIIVTESNLFGDNQYVHRVFVLAVADPPTVSAIDILQIEEDSDPVVLQVTAGRSVDEDNSETLSVVITVPSDQLGPVGSILQLSSQTGAYLTEKGNGVYEVTASGATPANREAELNAYLLDKVAFEPRAHWARVLTGENGIRVDAVSTEAGETAPSNSLEAGTLGDIDTRTEKATTYVNITVVPIVDIPYLANERTIVQENKGDSDVDQDLLIPIGSSDHLGIGIDDLDDSQSLYFELTGFPTDLRSLQFGISKPGVTTLVDIQQGNVTIYGENNVVDILAVLDSLQITLANDDDKNFLIEINGVARDTNGIMEVSEEFYLSHDVIVQAVADTPTLEVGTEIKPVVAEDSSIEQYAIITRINDVDGSESFKGESVDISLSTPTAVAVGADPIVTFGTSTGVEITQTPGHVLLSGSFSDIEAAMETFEIGPGPHNGEDITVVVSVTSVESNPTEDGEDEVAVPEVNVVGTFVVPVDPVIQGDPELNIPSLTVTGNEDTKITTGINVSLNGIVDTDGSEEYYVEVERRSFPTKTKFFVDNRRYWTNVGGWIRLPNPSSKLEVKAPPNFSGTISLNVRGRISDITMDSAVTKVTEAQTVVVNVLPIADAIDTPPSSEGVEDLGPVAFGSVLTASNGIRAKDNGGGVGNNAESETFSQIKFDVPADTAEKTYTITGPYALTSGSIPGVGTASVSLSEDSNGRTYIIISSITSDADDLTLLTYEQRVEASDDIMVTLATFEVEMGPTHTDLNGAIQVTVTTLDINLGLYNERNSSFDHQVIIKAVADAPSIFIHETDTVTTEDGANIPLKVTVSRSADDDGSEDLYVRVTVPTDSGGIIGSVVGATPSDVTLQNQGSGIFLITASCSTASECEDALNGFVDGGNFAFEPRQNWSGNSTLTVEVISVEKDKTEVAEGQYGGSDGDSEKEIAIDYVDITVKPVADNPTVMLKGNGIGFEDTKFDISIGVTLTDTDGSEHFTTEIDGASVPAGTTLFGSGESELTPEANGSYTLQPADVNSLVILPPLHWSSALQGNIILETTTMVTDESAGFSNTITFDFDITVVIVGVADPPNSRSVVVVAEEDEDYRIGQAIGSLDGVLVDDDGSETLSLVVGGLPPFTKIQTEGTAPYYIGSGEWQIELEDVPSMTITPLPHYSGDNPFPGFTFRAISQEMDGDESTSSDYWDVSFHVYPVADGFASWRNSVTVTESQNEDDGLGVSLAHLGNYTFVDSDGSESVVEFTFDLSNLIDDAKIDKRLEALVGSGATLDDLVDRYLDGVYDYNAGTELVTVAESNIAGMKLSAELFLDSNENFQIPVTALIKDVASIDGAEVSVTITSTGNYTVDLVGTADVPTVFADSVAGSWKIPISLGGESTDTDIALGREPSESVYYIVSKVDVGDLPGYSFVDMNSGVVGFGGGDGTWIMTFEAVESATDSGGLFFSVPKAPLGWNYTNSTLEPAIFQLMAVAVENDGDVATSTTSFSVSYWEYAGPGINVVIPDPLPPLVEIGENKGLEDVVLALNVTAGPDPNDTSNPTISIVFRDVPEGASITIPYYNNYVTGTKVALAEDVNVGKIGVTPPKDFSGGLEIVIDAVAVNANEVSATTAGVTVTLDFDPVADGVSIDIPGLVGNENDQVDLAVSITTKDIDSSEVLGPNAYVQVCDEATLNGNYDLVVTGDVDASVDDISVVEYYRVPINKVSGLSMQPDQYWHGNCDVTVVAYSIEREDDKDDDHLKANTVTFTAKIAAVATPPDVTAPEVVSGDEDTSIPLPGLSATLVDTIVENGWESLSVVFTDVAEDSSFSHGLNAGDGRWSIPVDNLSVLEYTPPPHFSGTTSLTFTAIARELDGKDEASSSASIQVEVAPVADDFFMVAKNIGLGSGDGNSSMLDLNVRLFDADEIITLTFGSVPNNVAMMTTNGGSIVKNEDDTWTFSGTNSSANALEVVSGSDVSGGIYTVTVSGYTTDGSVSLMPANTDEFRLTVQSSSRLLQSLGEIDLIRYSENPAGVRNCGSETFSLWDSSSGSFQLPMSSISLDSQHHSSVTYSVTHTPFDADVNINWVAVLYPDNPQGYTQCPVEVFSEGGQFALTGNCYDYRSEAYIFYNIQGNDAALDTIGALSIPIDCEVPEEFENGTTIAFKVSIPCSACLDESLSLPSPNNNLNRRLSNASSFKSRYSNEVLHSIQRPSRALQATGDELLSSDVMMEVLLSGEGVASSSSPFNSVITVAFTSLCLAAAFMF